MGNSLLSMLCERFPMSFGAIWLRMMALQVMERNRHDNPFECDRYGFEESSQWERD